VTDGQVKAEAALFRARLAANDIAHGLNPYATPNQFATIGTLKPGQRGYTLPWAFSLEYPVFADDGGTRSVPVGRDNGGRLWIGSEGLTALIMRERGDSE
jgi:hypothetical protein